MADVDVEKRSILIIDDDDSLRRIVEYFLREIGYQVFCASNADQGLREFETKKPSIVLTDLQMPGMSGLEVLTHIKANSPPTLVIVITAFGTIDNAVEAMKLGAYDFIAKPFSRDHLKLVIERALEFQGLREENSRLKDTLTAPILPGIIGVSDMMRGLVFFVRRVATKEATVLIQGESGTGKEMIARAIHEHSDRRNNPFVPVNCAAIPGELLESELFGHVKGAFTGAIRDRNGKFSLANGGTLFLDEVGEMPLELQPKLLRALQEREIEPVGGRPIQVDVRVIAATNRNLEETMNQGSFREDLYYRLAVVPIRLPPLRKRREDIPLLTAHFLKKHGNGTNFSLTDGALERLVAYDWPGNVRELENTVQRMLVFCQSDILDKRDIPPNIHFIQRSPHGVLNLPDDGYSLLELEKEAITEAMLRNDWNQTRAAAFLRIPRHILAYRLEKYGFRKQ